MVNTFRQKNPGNALFLLLYGLVIKFPMFLHPSNALKLEGDNYIYIQIVKFFDPLASAMPSLYPILAFILLFMQATLLNRLCNSLKLFPKPNYLVGMSYMMVTSLVVQWDTFSAPLLINSLFIWIWYSMIGWYNNNKPKTAIFNTSVVVGILPLIYSPAITYVILLLLALVVTRPPRVTEWLVALLGLATPYYFLFILLYLTDKWDWSKVIPPVSFHLPALPSSLWITAGIAFLIVPFLIGAWYAQANLSKMLIQVRKSWNLLLLALLVSLLIILINPGNSYMHWLLIAVPVAVFHAAAYYFPPGRFFPLLMHWIIFTFLILLQYAAPV